MNPIDRFIVSRYNSILRSKIEAEHKHLIPEFVDDEGRKWFTYAKGEVPVLRMAKIKTYYDILNRGLSGQVIDECYETHNKCLAHGDIVGAGVVMHDMKQLKDHIVNMDAFINIIAVSYVREDENPNTIADHIHAEKTNFLLSETEQGRFFFRTEVWKDCAKVYKISSMDVEQLLTDYRLQMERLQKRWSVLRSGTLSKK
jgi:hypothetical protein